MEDRIQKWRLILGDTADPQQDISLDAEAKGMDDVLGALYDSDRKGKLGSSAPHVNRWLGDIRKYFPTPVVQIMQRDALDRLGLTKMLMQPELLESMEPDIQLAATLISLQKAMPDTTRETARAVVRKIVAEIERKLKNPLREAISGSLHKASRSRKPKPQEINWHRTIQANLRHYQPEYQTIIPARLIGHGRKGQQLRHIILLLDQSGSMASSIVYAAVAASVLASLRSVKTNLIAFDTAVADLSDLLHDPVDLLFAAQLGGGTDINKALAYAQGLIRQPADTIIVLISDLFEGGHARQMISRCNNIIQSGAQLISLLALNDQGAPAYDHQHAAHLASLGIPCFACTPDQFPALIAKAIKKEVILAPPTKE
jgi:Mg-chelatase subunit ChlD